MHPVSIIGCGYTGSRLAERSLQLTARVQGFATRAASLQRIESMGGLATSLNLDQPVARSIDLDGRLVYYSVPPAPTGTEDPRLERLLEHAAGVPRRVVYLSTTGVYGDCHGSHVDEETIPRPQTERAVRRLAAEHTLRAWADARGVSWTVLRVPGIYGPGRMPVERLRRGEPAIEPTEATPGNRIHVDDLVSACVAAGGASLAHRRIYNVTDGSDDSLTAYLQRVARIAGLPPPPLVSRADARRTFSAAAWSFLGESRRVDNARMLTELGITLAYRDLDAGIRASL
jgi:nucleoside-diphosphate-sugar epimerase